MDVADVHQGTGRNFMARPGIIKARSGSARRQKFKKQRFAQMAPIDY